MAQGSARRAVAVVQGLLAAARGGGAAASPQVPWAAAGGARLWRSTSAKGGGIARAAAWRLLYGTPGVAGGLMRTGPTAATIHAATANGGASSAARGLSRGALVPMPRAAVRQLAVAAAAVTGGACVVVVGGSRVGSLASGAAVRSLWQDSRGYEHFQGRGRAWPLSGPRAMYTAGAVVAAAAAYYWYSLETVPYTGRRHSIMFVSSANERWMGKVVFEEQKALALAEGRLLPDAHPDSKRVRRLGQSIAAVAGDGAGGGHYSHMKHLDWEFAVIDNPTPNAFVLPGGKVVVFAGLLRLLGRSDDELAAVMAHEVGHVLARHQAERMSTLNVWTLLNMAMRLTLGFGLPNVAMYMGVFLPYSRLAEHEADLIGLRLMARACFDPVAAPSMLAKINNMEKEMAKRGSVAAVIPAFLRTHPLTEDRVKLVEKELADAYKLYLDAGCAGTRSAFGLGAWALGSRGNGGSWGGPGEEGESFRFS